MAELTQNRKSFIAMMSRGELHAARGFDLILDSGQPETFLSELISAGLLGPENNPRPRPADSEGFYRISSWRGMDYLKAVAGIAGSRGDIALGDGVMGIVRSITSYRDPEGVPTDNYHTHTSCAEIVGLVPLDCIADSDLEMVEVWLSSRFGNDMVVQALSRHVFGRFLSHTTEHAKKIIPAVRHCTELRADSAPARKARSMSPVADAYWLNELLKKHSAAIGKTCGLIGVDCLVMRMVELFASDYIETHTWVLRAAIEDHPQNPQWDYPISALVDGARDALNGWLSTQDPAAVEYVVQLLVSDHQIARRLAINAVRENWALLSEAFQGVIDVRLFDIGHIHEMFHLLEEKFAFFSPSAQEVVVEKILEATEVACNGPEALGQRLHLQRRWLIPLGGKGNARADSELIRLNQVCGATPEHPDLLMWHFSSVGFGSSPYSKDELIDFSRERVLLSRLADVPDESSFGDSSLKSLSDALIQAVADNPVDFFWILDSDLKIDRRTQYGLLSGFCKALGDRSTLQSTSRQELVGLLLQYMLEMVRDEAFWLEDAEAADVLVPTKDWIPPLLAGVGKLLAANDQFPLFDSEVHDLLEISRAVLLRTDGIGFSDDPMTSAINNSRGIAFESVLQLLLRCCRDADAAGTSHGTAISRFSETIQKELHACTGANFEVSVLAASFLAQLFYVDENWAHSLVSYLFPSAYAESFSCAVYGLAFAPASNKVYESLKLHEVPLRALSATSVFGVGRERMIERIALAYWWGRESLDSAIFEALLQSGREEDLCELLSTISRWSAGRIQDEQRERAVQLARKAVEFAKEGKASRSRILAQAAKFLRFLPRITETDMDWLVPAAEFAAHNHGAYEFTEALDDLAIDSPGSVAKLLEAFLISYRPSYDYEDRLQSLVRKLHASGERVVALRVVNFLIREGMRSFLDVYEELAHG